MAAQRSEARRLRGDSLATAQTVALYARVSTEDQAERATIQSQLDFLRRYADLHGLTVADEYVDDGISGTIPLDQRSDGRRLLVDAEAGRFRVVLLYRLDRLGRSLRALLAANDALTGFDVAVRSATEPFDTSTPIGSFLFQLLGSLAELEKSTISERTSMGRDRVAKAGRYTGGPVPIGYDVDDQQRLVPSTRLVPELGVSEADMVREVFARIASGESTLSKEAGRLTALGVPRRQRYGTGKVIERGNGWGISSLAAVLHNPLYMGAGQLDSRYGAVPRPVEALVDPVTWNAVQTALERNRSLSPKNAKHTYLLRGLVKCARCGLGYSGRSNKGKRMYRHYAAPDKPDRCESKILDADWLEGAVWAECRQLILNPGTVLDEARRKLRERMEAAAGADNRRRQLLDALAGKETERERVLTLYRKGTIDDDEAERELDAIAREAGQLRELLESLRAQAALLDAQEVHLTETASMLARIGDSLADIEASNDVGAKREIIEAYIRQVTVESQRLGPRKYAADVRVSLRVPAPAIAIDSTKAADGAARCACRRTPPGRPDAHS